MSSVGLHTVNEVIHNAVADLVTQVVVVLKDEAHRLGLQKLRREIETDSVTFSVPTQHLRNIKES